MLTVFWDYQAVLLAHFQKRGINVNSASYCEVPLKLRDVIHIKRPGELAKERYFFIMRVPESMHPKQRRKEFKSCSGNFLNIRLGS
jgi:hypothetical protein